MNQEIKARWVAALRSGEYAQDAGALRTDSGFCCLGVLCDLHAKETNTEWLLWVNGKCVYENGTAVLPQSVMLWAKLVDDTAFPRVSIEDQISTLTAHNDGLGVITRKTFIQIADAIEAQL